MQPEHGQKQNNESLKNLYVKTRRLIGKTPRWVFAYLSGVNPNTDKRFVKNGKSIVDARMYLVFRLRFIRCYSWAEVAGVLGKGYTEDGVSRMAYNYLNKN